MIALVRLLSLSLVAMILMDNVMEQTTMAVAGRRNEKRLKTEIRADRWFNSHGRSQRLHVNLLRDEVKMGTMLAHLIIR